MLKSEFEEKISSMAHAKKQLVVNRGTRTKFTCQESLKEKNTRKNKMRLDIVALLVFCIGLAHAMNSVSACGRPTGCHKAQNIGKQSVCRITCSDLRYNYEYLVCPTSKWETNMDSKYCDDLRGKPVKKSVQATEESTATLTAAPAHLNAASVARLVADVKQACRTAGCIVKREVVTPPRNVVPKGNKRFQ